MPEDSLETKPPRKKAYIEVSSSRRRQYLGARRGSNSDTNELTINIHTLIKSTLEEALVFTELDAEE